MSQVNFYNQYWQERGPSKGLRLRYQIFLDWVEPASNVLDLGGGDGQLAEILTKEKKCDVTLVDVSKEAVTIAEQRGIKAMIGSLEEKVSFGDSSFDVVILSEVLEHLVNSEKVLQEAARLSKNLILISLPNTGYLRYRLQLLFGRFPRQWLFSPIEHLRFWTVADSKKMVNDSGLKILEIKASAGRRYLRDFWPSLMAEQICYRLKKL